MHTGTERLAVMQARPERATARGTYSPRSRRIHRVYAPSFGAPKLGVQNNQH